MDRAAAWDLLCEYTKNESLRKHALAVEGCLSADDKNRVPRVRQAPRQVVQDAPTRGHAARRDDNARTAHLVQSFGLLHRAVEMNGGRRKWLAALGDKGGGFQIVVFAMAQVD